MGVLNGVVTEYDDCKCRIYFDLAHVNCCLCNLELSNQNSLELLTLTTFLRLGGQKGCINACIVLI